uniref:DNA 3'-5' helicase n=1 Tax=Spongospora subterranea TaxID=70186 RepID=A0A0H5QYA2_9EUKA|eukprot:CRZ06702.1 hypothetical protein [Spongospora subterranea]
MNPAQFYEEATDICRRMCHELNGTSKILIFMMSVAAIDLFAASLRVVEPNILIFHGQLDPEEKSLFMTRWPSCRCVVATSAFGAGVDCPEVRAVVHITGAYDIISFAQESGRAGRDGRPATSLTISNEMMRTSMLHLTGNGPDSDLKIMFDWIANAKKCRRQFMHSHLDQDAQPCISWADAQLCDICCDDQNAVSQSEWSPTGPAPTTDSGGPASIVISIPALQAERACHNREQLKQRLWKILKEIGPHCIFCYAKSRHLAKHTLHQCALMRKRCLKCCGSHPVSQCKYKFCPSGIIGTCYACALPQQEGFHDQQNCQGKHPAYDKVWPLSWAIMRSEHCSTHIQRVFGKVDDDEACIHKFLFQQDSNFRVSMMVIIFVEFFKHGLRL